MYNIIILNIYIVHKIVKAQYLQAVYMSLSKVWPEKLDHMPNSIKELVTMAVALQTEL